jgi:hypothetical protein
VTAKRNFTKRHTHGIKKRTSSSPPTNAATGMDSTATSNSSSSSSKRRRKEEIVLEGSNEDKKEPYIGVASQLVNVTGINSDDDNLSYGSKSADKTVRRTGGTRNKTSSGNALIMITRREASLLELVKARPSSGDKVALDKWLQDVVDATSSNDSHNNILNEEILTDDDEDDAVKLMHPPMQSIEGRLDIFTESFEKLIMK